MYKPGKEKATRIEFRSPDPACNPYLAFAVMLGAGMDGIEKNMELPDPIEEDIFEMNPAERRGPRHHGSARESLRGHPGNGRRASWFERSWEITSSTSSSRTRRSNGTRYRTHVSQFEIDRYLTKL